MVQNSSGAVSHAYTGRVNELLDGYIENTYIVLPYMKKKNLTRLGELIIFEPWRENDNFSRPS